MCFISLVWFWSKFPVYQIQICCSGDVFSQPLWHRTNTCMFLDIMTYWIQMFFYFIRQPLRHMLRYPQGTIYHTIPSHRDDERYSGVFSEGITRSGVRLERWVYTVYNRRSASELRAGCHSGGDLLWQGWERTTPARQTCTHVSNKVWWQTETFNSMRRNLPNSLWVNLTTGLYNIHGKLFMLVKIWLIIYNMNTVEFETAR